MSRGARMNAMKNVTRIACALVCASGGQALAAKARPGLVAPGLAGEARAQLVAEVARARKTDGAAFAALARVKGFLPSSYKVTRGRQPEVSRELVALGPRALVPMLEVMALTGFPTRAALSEPERAALEAGLFEAVGALGDPRADAVLEAALAGSTDEHVLRGAARALARRCSASEPAQKQLIQYALKAGPKQAATLDGLGLCQAVSSATTLGLVLGRTLEPSAASQAAHALGQLGSAWAWEARGQAALGEQVRSAAAEALINGAARAPDESQADIQEALVVVAHPSTDALLAHARAGGNITEAGRRRLDALALAWDARRR